LIRYREGYRYQLHETYSLVVAIRPAEPIRTRFITLRPDGKLTMRWGYAWDGPSWAIATKSFMRGSLTHDALYQLLRGGHLEQSWRKQADLELVRICEEDGMWGIRRWWVYRGVRIGAGPAAAPQDDEILSAP